MKLDRYFASIIKVIHSLSKAGGWISAFGLFLMMLLVAVDVIGRYVFNNSIRGAMEIDELMMVIVVFLVLAYCTLEKGHISVELLVSHVSKRAQMIMESITCLASLAIIVLITWQIGVRGLLELGSTYGGVSLLLGIPQAPLLILASLACVLLSLELLIAFFQAMLQIKTRQ